MDKSANNNNVVAAGLLAIPYLFIFSLICFPLRNIFVAMFSDFSTDVTGFESCPETEKVVNDSSCQTVDLRTIHQETQTTSVDSTASQATSEDALRILADQPYDANKLLKFLNRILPHLEDELKNCDFSSDLSFNQNDADYKRTDNESSEKTEESYKQIILRPDFCKEKIVSCLSWNSSSVMLAIAYSENSHISWCCHETSVGLFNTWKPQFQKESPTHLLKVPGCVRCIEFHSDIPSLLAGGLYNGDIVVWDLRLDEEVLMINKKIPQEEAAHVDVINYLTWREDENGLWLVTAGRDGRIILWKVTVIHLTYEVQQRFIILKQHLTTTAAAAPNEHLEVLQVDFQFSKGPYFVAACDGGTIFYCSLNASGTSFSFPKYKDPVIRSYKPRKGIVTGVSCSSDFFASCGTDSEIHIFKYEQEFPILKILTSYVTLGVKWNSPAELVSWGSSILECHKIDSAGKSLICEVEGNISAVAFKILRQNRKFAIGNQKGDILILRDWIST